MGMKTIKTGVNFLGIQFGFNRTLPEELKDLNKAKNFERNKILIDFDCIPDDIVWKFLLKKLATGWNP